MGGSFSTRIPNRGGFPRGAIGTRSISRFFTSTRRGEPVILHVSLVNSQRVWCCKKQNGWKMTFGKGKFFRGRAVKLSGRRFTPNGCGTSQALWFQVKWSKVQRRIPDHRITLPEINIAPLMVGRWFISFWGQKAYFQGRLLLVLRSVVGWWFHWLIQG